MEQPKVYADITFLINFTMDFFILWTTAKLCAIKPSYGRLGLVSTLGALYGVGYLFSALAIFYSLPVKVAFSALLVIAALRPRGRQELKRVLFYFYGVSFMMAGATLALPYLGLGGSRQTYWYLLGGIGSALLLGVYGGKYLLGKIVPSLLKYRIELHFGSKVCQGEGFLDTGNSLRDPITKRPVLVAEYKLLRDCFPEDCRAAVENFQDENDILQALTQSSWASRLRLIPYSSIGKKNGLMVGFRCDQMIVDPARYKLLYRNMIVGVYLDQLSSKNDYQMLIPAEILQNV